MNAFVQTFNTKAFKEKFSEIKPTYIFMGKVAYQCFQTLLDKSFLPLDMVPYEGYRGEYKGAKVYIVPHFPSDEIIFGVE